MTRMGSSPSSKGGVILFLILQINLPLIVMGVTTISSTDSTTNMDDTATTANTIMISINTPTNFPVPPSSSSSTIAKLTNSMPPSTSTTNMDDTASTANTTMISINTPTNFPVPGSNNTNMSMIYCPVFTCNVSQCYNTYLNTNATMCADPAMFCELRRDDPMRYSVNCVPVCRTSCNGSQINCSVSCCNSDICLNSTIANLTNSMPPMIPTTTPATANTTTTTTTAPTTTTAATNGKKCNKVTCTGDICYQSNLATMLCSPTQHYCMLKKSTSGTVMTWTAGCSEDCRKETACSSTVTTCFLECCNATTTASCLKMTGVLNMPSSATRGLFSPMLLIISSLLFWLLSMVTSA